MAKKKGDIRPRNVEKILLAAERVFAEKGYAGAAMGDIAQLADLPKSNVHYYFATMEELYREVLLGLLDARRALHSFRS
nr:helix-turn-helix domain-containing protein [Halomonas sp. 1513]